jgi:hypothetical protein
MKFRQRIQLLEMKIRGANLILLLVLLAMIASFCGCSSVDSDNASVRPWNSPQSWENGLGGMDQQRQ